MNVAELSQCVIAGGGRWEGGTQEWMDGRKNDDDVMFCSTLVIIHGRRRQLFYCSI